MLSFSLSFFFSVYFLYAAFLGMCPRTLRIFVYNIFSLSREFHKQPIPPGQWSSSASPPWLTRWILKQVILALGDALGRAGQRK